MAGTTGYNLTHLQVAAKGASPVYKDILYATTAEFPISQDKDVFRADGSAVVTAWSAPSGDGSIGFGSADLDTIAVMTGGTKSTTGSAGTAIDRLEIKGNTTPTAVIFVAWIPNVDGNSTQAGLRITIPNASASVPSTSYAQESWTEFSSDVGFNPDENGNLLIWESLATAPTFTSGVIPTNLTAPGA